MDTLTSEPQTPVERAWSEYLHWVRGSSPWQYEETERAAWVRLQLALLEGAGRTTATPATADGETQGR